MANTKSAKKRARTNEVRRSKNVARRSDVKTACKKVEEALVQNQSDKALELFRIAEAKIARASAKGIMKKNNASRKVSRLAKKVSSLVRATK